MPREVAPNVYRLPVPMPHSPEGSVNVYLLVALDGVRLIDCGWDTPEAYAALCEALRELGRDIGDVREVVLTHMHPDHYGLAVRVASASGAHVAAHRREIDAVARMDTEADRHALMAAMERWFRRNGTPDEEIAAFGPRPSLAARALSIPRPDVLLDGGEMLTWGDHAIEVIWTPGHAPGHICLHDRTASILFSGDHILEHGGSFIGLQPERGGDPLRDYLDSLARVRDVPVHLVLPAHGAPFAGLASRVDALRDHHARRCEQIRHVLAHEELTAYAVARRLRWRGVERGWDRLAPTQRRMALSETLAHLAYLSGQGDVVRHESGEVIVYVKAPAV